ncbi:MAG: hypothetical protein HeimC2_37160 [Candidatus Heimdallarchaeota archaeon LC_2]|nr:MAG: hypothetical protein HeimC2_37160 [Candidatus Heimdallarchaeota archaeon LC_2]
MSKLSKNGKLAVYFINEVFAKRQFNLLDSIIHPDYHLDIEGGVTSQQTQIYEDVSPIIIGIEGLKHRLTSYFKWLSQLKFDILDVVSEHDSVIIRYIQEFVFVGKYRGVESKAQTIRIKGYLFVRIIEDKIISMDFLGDYFKFLTEIGLVTTGDQNELKTKEFLNDLSGLNFLKS